MTAARHQAVLSNAFRRSMISHKPGGTYQIALAFAKVVAMCGGIAALGGCAFTTGHVNVAYQAAGNATKVALPDSPPVSVEVSDKRPSQAVGQKINGFGMKTADIVADNDVASTLKGAFESELKARGFTEAAGGDLISVRVYEFQNQYTLGFFSGDATASLGMDIAVKRPDGSVAYQKTITGQAKDWVEIAGEDNAQRVLNLAMQDALNKVFDDSDFIAALKNPAPPAKAAS